MSILAGEYKKAVAAWNDAENRAQRAKAWLLVHWFLLLPAAFAAGFALGVNS